MRKVIDEMECPTCGEMIELIEEEEIGEWLPLAHCEGCSKYAPEVSVIKSLGYTCIVAESAQWAESVFHSYLDPEWDFNEDEIEQWVSIADEIIADDLSEMYGGLPVVFGTSYNSYDGKPLYLDTIDQYDYKAMWCKKYNEIYCDAAETAYYIIMDSRQ